MSSKSVVIFGGGPAGLTAAYEFLERSRAKSYIYEMTDQVGGLSKTVKYRGNIIDLGGHRFFTTLTQIERWWTKFLTLSEESSVLHLKNDNILLLKHRVSSIYARGKFYDYPLSISKDMILNIGLLQILKIVLSYVKAQMHPIKDEKSLQDFLINRFGKELHNAFFKSYTEKVWGIPCFRIKPDWGKERIQGFSLRKAIVDAVKTLFIQKAHIKQGKTEKTITKSFLYPKFGAGQIWEEVAGSITQNGGEIYLNKKIVRVRQRDGRITASECEDTQTGRKELIKGDYYISTIPLKTLIRCMGNTVPNDVREITEGLMYRDFMIVGILLKKLKIKNKRHTITKNNIPLEQWIYIQEPDVKMGRIQIFNNWSPYMVANKNHVWIGGEYFCTVGDNLWNKTDKGLFNLAVEELVKMGFIDEEDIIDGTVIRVPKAYPVYSGTYKDIQTVRDYLDGFENLYLIGRNGRHKYCLMDSAMLSAMIAARNILNGVTTKDNVWDAEVK